jgi:glyoxylase-like metal-dependent hydrolase (beta-lactamase superfamily II)
MARVNLPAQYNPPTYTDTRINVYAYLVVTDSDVILIDTGVGAGNKIIEDRFAPLLTPITEELARFDISLPEVSIIVNSHLHFDHCGNNAMFPDAEIYVQERELEIARNTRYTVTNWFDYNGARIKSIAGDMEISKGVKLLASPGHTPGHQSVFLESTERNILMAAQAAYTADEYLRGGDPVDQAHEGLGEVYVQSITRLKSLDAAQVYFSNDDQAAKNS